MERAVVLGLSELIQPEDLPESVMETAVGGDTPVGGYQEGLIEAKKRLILGAIDQAGGSHLAAAKLLGVNPVETDSAFEPEGAVKAGAGIS